MNLADFLLARIAEDEWAAQQARAWATGSRDEGQPIDWRIHTRNWSPARVLAECDAKRRIVELHAATPLPEGAWRAGEMVCAHDENWYPCETLGLLALPYADHPDYHSEWKP